MLLRKPQHCSIPAHTHTHTQCTRKTVKNTHTHTHTHTHQRQIYWINTQHPILKVPPHQFPPQMTMTTHTHTHTHTHVCNYIDSTNLNECSASPSQLEKCWVCVSHNQ